MHGIGLFRRGKEKEVFGRSPLKRIGSAHVTFILRLRLIFLYIVANPCYWVGQFL